MAGFVVKRGPWTYHVDDDGSRELIPWVEKAVDEWNPEDWRAWASDPSRIWAVPGERVVEFEPFEYGVATFGIKDPFRKEPIHVAAIAVDPDADDWFEEERRAAERGWLCTCGHWSMEHRRETRMIQFGDDAVPGQIVHPCGICDCPEARPVTA